ncbi:hypothetical protein [Nocardioides zeae]|uniref:Uncharacterized protein n=1 Tax=Nocardioides zeae TaxID=1457234 RepID=A0AAJ1U222_9ACTN|nr:hypothetical protein [Nocardioides zeae]MDQ1106540.1 hypothetical protein [Nocardioides zeae]
MPAPDRSPAARLTAAATLRAVVGGVVALLLFLGLAVALPAVVDEDDPADGADGAGASADPDSPLELPVVAGDWVSLTRSVDLETLPPEQQTTVARIDAAWAYADDQLAADAGVATDADRYVIPDTQTVVAVQAYRGPDGPLVPATLADPSSGDARLLLQSFGDVDCVLDVIAGEVSPTPQVQEMQCRRTSEDLTIRVFVLSGASGTQVQELIDALWSELDGPAA